MMSMSKINTDLQVENQMIHSTLLFEMKKGTFGALPFDGARGPRSNDGGFYARVNRYCLERFGREISKGYITQLKNEAIRLGAETVEKRSRKPKAKVYPTALMASVNENERQFVNEHQHVSDSGVVNMIQQSFAHLAPGRKKTASGILRSYRDRGQLIGVQRFTLLMGWRQIQNNSNG